MKADNLTQNRQDQSRLWLKWKSGVDKSFKSVTFGGKKNTLNACACDDQTVSYFSDKAYPDILNIQLLNSFLATERGLQNPMGLHLQ